jgi:Family of unknown function (DUF5335)
VTLEVAGRDLGDQIAADHLVLTGITYDDKDDVLVVGLDAPGGSPEEYQHMIYGPQQISVATTDDGETFFDVTDSEGRQHLIHVQPAPALPPAQTLGRSGLDELARVLARIRVAARGVG